MTDTDQLRRLHQDHALALAPRLVERLDWPPERLAAHRRTRLRELLWLAVDRSPWHRRRLAGIDIDQFEERHLAELPVMAKHDLMEHFDEIVTDERLTLDLVEAHLDGLATGRYLLDRYTVLASGGSSGLRGTFVYDWDGWAVFFLGLARRYLPVVGAGGGADPPLLASVEAAGPGHATAALGWTFTGPRLPRVVLPVTLPMADIVDGLNRAQPAILKAYSSALGLLAAEARAGRLRIRPRLVMSGAEPLLPEVRAAVEAAWGVTVGNVWGVSEAGPVGAPCGHGATHISDDLAIVEAVDADGRPVEPGTPATKVYLTNLFNHVLPLIRYELSDRITVLSGSCPCGSAFRRIADIEGRSDDVFVYGSCAVHPHGLRSALGRRGIVDYQVHQTAGGVTVQVVVSGAVDVDAVGREIAAHLAGLGVTSPEVAVAVVDRIDRPAATGKLRRFVPLPAASVR